MHYNVVIVGSGLAGLYAALHLAESNMRVLLLSKQAPKDSSSAMAQGGVAAVLEREDDSFALHRDDTLAAGNYKNDIDAVETLVHEGPEDVRRVMSLGVQFDRTPEGELAMTIEGGHSRRRVVHRADRTGREMMDKLVPHVREQANATLLEDATAYASEKIEGGGFLVDALVAEQPMRFSCDFLLLATGGIGQVYRHTTNPAVCTGDGIRLAHELGAKLRNMRYVQFHPTAFAGGGDEVSRFLITEAVRGEGGRLLNANHERFMHHYDPREELAPRDVVSRAIVLETQRIGSTDVFLDIRHRGEAFLRQRFPGINQNCLRRGVDITKDLIPVFPCQHYHMGGIEVDLHSRTSVPGLYAAGECAHTGLHGGNRLASNSLPEALVFGRRAAQDIMRNAQCVMRNAVQGERPNNYGLCNTNYEMNLQQIKTTMQETFFVFPNKAKLPAAAAQMRKLYEDLARETATPTREVAELRSLACVAMLVLEELL